MKKICLVLVVLAMLLGCGSALASPALASVVNPVGNAFLYLGGGLVVLSSVLVMFDKRLD